MYMKAYNSNETSLVTQRDTTCTDAQTRRVIYVLYLEIVVVIVPRCAC